MTTFSVLLPTHNRADVLPFAVRSVLAQTFGDFELLVVGDGCTDRTAEVVRGFADPRVRWFDLPKAPHFGYANRNVALRQARGEFVAFMAHDDLWLPDHLELLLPLLGRPGVELAYSRPLWVIPPGLLAPGAFNLEYPTTLADFLAKRRNGIPAGCVVHRRECFARYGYWDESLPRCGDLDMWARIIEGGGRKNFAYATEPTCLHFLANWRKDVTFGQPELGVWGRLHALGDFLPAALKVHVPRGVTEQEAVWRAMSARPRGWAAEVRSAARQALDARVSHADELLSSMLRLQPSLGFDAASLGEPAKMVGPLEQFAADAAQSEASFGWRLVRGLRAARAAAAPPGSLRGRAWSSIERRFRRPA